MKPCNYVKDTKEKEMLLKLSWMLQYPSITVNYVLRL